MSILLFGAHGQVGDALARILEPTGELVAVSHDSTKLCGDFTNPAGVLDTIASVRPHTIINAAAYTAVDRAEQEPGQAQMINATTPALIARAAVSLDAWLVHYSTDYVFDGTGSHARRESDSAAPLSAYGESKLHGDSAIMTSGCRHLILRTSWVHSPRGTNFVRTILRLAQTRDHLTIVSDQIGAPSAADWLANMTVEALGIARRRPDVSGLYHLVPNGYVSWHGVATFVVATARELGFPVTVADDAIHPIATADLNQPAARPLNSRLDTTKVQTTFGLQLPPWQTGVTETLEALRKQNDG